MASPRENAGSVLGKRSHQTAQVEASEASCDFDGLHALPSPDSTPNPKRTKTTGSVLDGDHNKENIPPFLLEAINASPTTIRRTRSLRRTSTMTYDVSSRPSSELASLACATVADVVISASAVCVDVGPTSSGTFHAGYFTFAALLGDPSPHSAVGHPPFACSCEGPASPYLQRRSAIGRS